MMASIEQLVAAFENSPAAGSSTAAQTSSTDGTSAGGSSANATGGGSGSNASMDGISVDLPNGSTFDGANDRLTEEKIVATVGFGSDRRSLGCIAHFQPFVTLLAKFFG